MKKKGFTLVELLAVIAILAILVIMALPAVLKMYNKARRDTFNNELNTIIRTARQQYLLSGGQAGTYSKDSNPLSLTGNSELNYCITINGQGQITGLQATNGSYKYESNGIVSETSSSDVETAESEYTLSCSGGSSSSLTYVNRQTEGSITVGDEVAIDTEHFYVISSDSTNTALLAKYDLKQDGSGYTQDSSGTDTNLLKVNFLDSNNIAYWDGQKSFYDSVNTIWSPTNSPAGLISPYSDNGKAYCTSTSETNCAYVYDNNTSNIYPVVTEYANKISVSVGATVTGRLMSLEEANSLSVDIRKDRNGYYYWLGSAYSSVIIWTLSNYHGSIYNTDSMHPVAIRPIIEIPTSSMPN